MFKSSIFRFKWLVLLTLLVAVGGFYLLFTSPEETYATGNVGREHNSNIQTRASFLSGGVDTYTFYMYPNRILFVDVDAEIYRSKLDPVIRILDNNDQEVAVNDDDLASLDSSIAFVIPETGYYTIEITDFTGAEGGNEYFYLLNYSMRTCE